MASISTGPNGRKRLQFCIGDGRPAVWLGKMGQRQAERIRDRVDDLLSLQITGDSPPPDLTRWISGLSDDLHAKLAKHGLVASRDATTMRTLVDAVLADRKGKVSQTTWDAFASLGRNLCDQFGPDRRIHDLTTRDAEEFRRWLIARKKKNGAPLSEATVSLRIRQVKQIFNLAVDFEWLAKSPFRKQSAGDETNTGRDFDVTPAIIAAVLDEIADPEFRAMVIIARFGGLRCPSEVAPLQWRHVNWEKSRLVVTASKTNQVRIVPLYREVREALEGLYDRAPVGATLLFPTYQADWRSRQHLKQAILHAGLAPWPKPWQNMRITRENELFARFPAPTVVQWQGHSPKIAAKHYARVPEPHFQDAAEWLTLGKLGGSGETITCPHCGRDVPLPSSQSGAESSAL